MNYRIWCISEDKSIINDLNYYLGTKRQMITLKYMLLALDKLVFKTVKWNYVVLPAGIKPKRKEEKR